MRPLTQLLLVTLMAYVAYGQRADFIKMMQERANLHIRHNPGFSLTAVEPPKMPSAARIASAVGEKNKMMSDDGQYNPEGFNNGQYNPEGFNNGQYNPEGFNNGQYNPEGFNNGQYNPEGFNDGKYDERAEADAAILAADRERLAMEKERQAAELEKQKEMQAVHAKQIADQEEHQMKLREREQALEEKLRNEQAAREEARLEREQAERERQAAHQAQLEEQRQAMENHRIEMENHRKEMEAAQRQREQENMEKFREHQAAIEEKVRAQEEALREQEAAQREFEAAQKEQEAAQREAEKERWQSQLEAQNAAQEELGFGRMIGKETNACTNNPCQNSGVCELTEDGFKCVCQKPWTGDLCETVWTNLCTEENLRNSDISQFRDPWNDKGYIICTDINIFHSMPCSEGTYFNENYGHCVREGYNPPVCPRNFCQNEAECLMDEEEKFRCVCKTGFTGEFCEENIDECSTAGGNEACAGGKCVDQLNGYYCQCPDNMIGLNCANDTIANPCTAEVIQSKREFFIVPCEESRTFLQCTGLNTFVVRQCPVGLFWHQEELACSTEQPMAKTGHCLNFPCLNGGDCQDRNGTHYECVCKTGYEGEHCENMIDSCASNPCQNGGRCLSYAGGYTCACPDKIIDECCCHALKNPCPRKSMIIPGVNNYFPHLFKDRYIHCDFDGRAFARKCSEGLTWSQNALSCLPNNFLIETTTSTTTTTLAPNTTTMSMTTSEDIIDLFIDPSVEMNQEAEKKKTELDVEKRKERLMERAKTLSFRRRFKF